MQPTNRAPQLTIQPLNFARADAAPDPGTWQGLIDVAVAADRSGVDRIIVSDHVAFGTELDAYADPDKGGVANGRQPTGPSGHWLEPLTTLTFLAARTEQVRLGTAILLAALRRPAVLAKTASTLDVLSGGRLDLGVGVGWQRAEYEACGLRFEDRGRLLNHTIEVCQELWTNEPATYAASELTFADIHQMPKPVADTGVPVWVSGTVNPRAMQRLARFGAGWIPWGPAVADPLAGIQGMRQAMVDFDRDPDTVQATTYLRVEKTPDGDIDLAATCAQAPALIEAGYTDCKLSLPIPTGVDAATEYLGAAVDAFSSATA